LAAVDHVRRHVQQWVYGHLGCRGPVAAQDLRASYCYRDRDQAAARLHDWTMMSIYSGVPELGQSARTITNSARRVPGLLQHRTNQRRPTDAVNLLIKKILRVVHGFRKFLQTIGFACC
jgi:hypothetical protein